MIPQGYYDLGFRNEGGKYREYTKKFVGHKGMIEVQNVLGRKYILFHIGNTAKDSEGCILLGNRANTNLKEKGFVCNSKDTYIKYFSIKIKVGIF